MLGRDVATANIEIHIPQYSAREEQISGGCALALTIC